MSFIVVFSSSTLQEMKRSMCQRQKSKELYPSKNCVIAKILWIILLLEYAGVVLAMKVTRCVNCKFIAEIEEIFMSND